MSAPPGPAETDAFAGEPAGVPEAAFVVDLDGFEGPLDLLLTLARQQKVDLRRISVLALAEQYLSFIEDARKLRLELAADYLVMAAWLADLKSRLLLPNPPRPEGPTAEDIAASLAARLERLERIREAAVRLGDRPLLTRERFARGLQAANENETKPAPGAPVRYTATLYDLLKAYAEHRQKQARSAVTLHRRKVWSLAEAREILERMVGPIGEWTALDEFLVAYLTTPETRTTVKASTFSAMLELVREGRIDMAQAGAFGPLMVRGKAGPTSGEGSP